MIAVSIVFKTPAFIAHQQRLMRRMVDAEYVVVCNDAKNYGAIQRECDRLGVRCYHAPRWGTISPSWSHALALNWAWDNVPGDEVLLMDMDVFPIQPVKDMGQGWPMAGVPQLRDLCYPWPGLFWCNRRMLAKPEAIRFDPCPGRDTGGRIADYLVRHTLAFRAIPESEHEHGSLIDKRWLHFGGATNWRGLDEEEEAKRRQRLFDYLEGIP